MIARRCSRAHRCRWRERWQRHPLPQR